jgi:transcription-repair coupling factor (superfamily II helicase)
MSTLTHSFPPLEPARRYAIAPLPFSAQAFAIAELARHSQKPILHIAASDRDAEQLQLLLHFIAPSLTTALFPAWDALPYDRVSPSHAVQAERMTVLAALCSEAPPQIILTTATAAMQYLVPRGQMAFASSILRSGNRFARDGWIASLTEQGYARVSKVTEPGEVAVRGSIIDLFPAHGGDAVRIDMFGDDIESIRVLDPLTQRSGDAISEIMLCPASEVMLNDETIDRFRIRYREHFGAAGQHDPLYQAISERRVYAGMEHWLPLFYEKLDTLFDYMPKALVSMDKAVEASLAEHRAAIADFYQARRERESTRGEDSVYHPLPPDALYVVEKLWETALGTRALVQFSGFEITDASQGIATPIQAAPKLHSLRHAYDGNLWDALGAYVRQQKTPVVFACNSPGAQARLEKLLSQQHLTCASVGTWQEACRLSPATVGLTSLPITHGFLHPALQLFSEEDALGERIIRTQKKRKKSEAFMAEAAGFELGEYVVHKEHGIGRFEGLITIEVSGAAHDCLKLVYAEEARLFLPVENIDLITRFGQTDGEISLDKLGGVAWQKRKAGLKKRLKMAAEALLKIAAERAMRFAPAIAPEGGLYDEFIARFPYTETEDQLQSIEDVLEDLRAGKPMDRLICGDVGFGKTEVAMRATFAAVANAREGEAKLQVALIAPTTLLARQHYQNFQQRFRGFPLTIRALSRLVSSKDAAKTREMLASGECDIVIGTHALLAKDITFKNLGLVIVDEEQHFGVAQKEKLKNLRSNVHVLTLSATPIPRTLQLSLAGVRELSLITTPPVDRLAVRTHVMPFDAVVLREAMLREQHRGGKIFYVTPRVKYMAELKQKLEELVPELRIAVAHGQLSAGQLDQVMNEFYDGKHDVLLSTAIIESGIDIPTANTIIIDRADMFGLAQLYQLRGRVGRSKTRAYAYFLLPPGKMLTRDATRRLEVMQQLDTLGAGFQLASHDMDIRGYGNLLGEEQSGHIREVGVELYQSMLEEAIAEQKLRKGIASDEDMAEDWSPSINIGSSVLIPEAYVEDLSLRLALYRRASQLDSEEALTGFAAELTDRFGTPPSEVEHFLDVLRIKLWCKRAGIERVDAGPKGAVVTFRNNVFSRPEALLGLMNVKYSIFKIRADQKLIVAQEWQTPEARMRGVEAATKQIAALAA